MANDQLRYGFVGAGKMATALIRGMLRSGVAEPDRIIATDPLAEARQRLHEATGVSVDVANAEAVRGSDVVVLAVQPPVVAEVLCEIAPLVTDQPLVVSIAAGVSIAQLLAGLGADRRVVRVMPNAPALVAAGAAGYCLGGSATAQDAAVVESLFRGVGLVWPMAEGNMDAVTGLSGSGPAYVFAVIEALSDGGVRMGLPRAVATALAAQTVLGAARMVQETGLHPAQLKDQVASPGGTTIAGLHALERRGLRAALIDAVQAATLRCRQLGRRSR